MDMCDGYMEAAKDIFDQSIPIVVDRFHVAQLCRKSLNKLRSSELKRLKKQLSDEEYKSLRPSIKLLIEKSECYLAKDKKILEPLFKLSPAIKAAYKLARELTHIYNTHHRKRTAKNKMQVWIEKVKTSDVSYLHKFSGTVENYCNEICNYFTGRYTSGWVEGINNKLKVIKRRCYGILNPKHFFQRIFLDLQGYDIFIKKQTVA